MRADQLRDLVLMGLTPEQVLQIEEIADRPSKDAIRMRNKRERVRNTSRHVPNKCEHDGEIYNNFLTSKPLKKDIPVVDARDHPKVVDRFDDFWKIYPKRKNNSKHKAHLKFTLAVKKGVDPQEIIEAAEAYAEDRAGQDPQYTAMAVTWLNGKPWENQEEDDHGEDFQARVERFEREILRANNGHHGRKLFSQGTGLYQGKR